MTRRPFSGLTSGMIDAYSKARGYPAAHLPLELERLRLTVRDLERRIEELERAHPQALPADHPGQQRLF